MFRDNLDQVANEGRLITVRDRRIRLYEEGTGPTAVVIVTGAGDCADSWLPIRHHLARSYRIISYDRAAIGGAQDVAPATVDRYLTEPRARRWLARRGTSRGTGGREIPVQSALQA